MSVGRKEDGNVKEAASSVRLVSTYPCMSLARVSNYSRIDPSCYSSPPCVAYLIAATPKLMLLCPMIVTTNERL